MNYRGGMWEGGSGQDGVEGGGKWDNCNSIINKYILKKEIKTSQLNNLNLYLKELEKEQQSPN